MRFGDSKRVLGGGGGRGGVKGGGGGGKGSLCWRMGWR